MSRSGLLLLAWLSSLSPSGSKSKLGRVPAQLFSRGVRRERRRAGQEMPSRSQELQWFMCAGMLRKEDLGLEESKGPGLRIDLLSRRITKWVGIWLRESFLKGIASWVFPSGMLTSTHRFDVTSIKPWSAPLFFVLFWFVESDSSQSAHLKHVKPVLKWSVNCIA